MKILLFLSDSMIPLLIFSIVGYGLLCHGHVYDDFIKGAKDGFQTVIGIMPTLIGLMVGVGVLRASGFLELLSSALGVITEPLHFPAELVPVSIVKMFSSSAATGLVLDIFKQYGPDSYYGTITSIRDCFLYDEHLLYDGKSTENKIYAGRSLVHDAGGNCGKRNTGSVHAVSLTDQSRYRLSLGIQSPKNISSLRIPSKTGV